MSRSTTLYTYSGIGSAPTGDYQLYWSQIEVEALFILNGPKVDIWKVTFPWFKTNSRMGGTLKVSKEFWALSKVRLQNRMNRDDVMVWLVEKKLSERVKLSTAPSGNLQPTKLFMSQTEWDDIQKWTVK